MKRILILEDVPESLTWLSEMAETAFEGSTVHKTRNIREALFAIKGHAFDLALVDLGLPDGPCTDVVKALSASQPSALIVVATIMGDDTSIINALSAGAHGYLLKDSPPDTFLRQLREMERGIPALSPSVARRILEHFRRTAVSPQAEPELTPRERDVLGLIGRGLRNADTARALGLTESTVASYIKSIYAKLGINSRAEAALLAVRLGLVAPEEGS